MPIVGWLYGEPAVSVISKLEKQMELEYYRKLYDIAKLVLTPAQREVLELYIAGLTVTQIAEYRHSRRYAAVWLLATAMERLSMWRGFYDMLLYNAHQYGQPIPVERAAWIAAELTSSALNRYAPVVFAPKYIQERDDVDG
ncbi:hypothetical protein [Thermosyntropha lipolytica]|nr:hypothetical protein [Thermosyntropha lipolytica]